VQEPGGAVVVLQGVRGEVLGQPLHWNAQTTGIVLTDLPEADHNEIVGWTSASDYARFSAVFLDDDDTQTKLQAFNDAVKGSEGSHLVVIPPSSKLLSDQLVATPILLGENASGAGGAGGSGGGGEEFEFGFDPALEPELALALRMSMEEEKARQEKRAREEEEAAKKASLEGVKEEDEAGGSGSGSGAQNGDKKDGGDKMDTT